MGQQRQHGRVVRALRVHGKRAQMALPQFHLHQRIGERPEPHAAMLNREEGQPQPLGAGFGAQLGQHFLVGLAICHFLLGRDAFLLHPFAHALAYFLGLFRYREINRHVSLPCLYDREASAERRARKPDFASDGLKARPSF